MQPCASVLRVPQARWGRSLPPLIFVPSRQRSRARWSLRMFSASSVRSKNARHDLFRYTSGRFLFDEEAQLKQRYKEFSIPALQDVAVKVTATNKCVAMSKLAEGSFNKVFLLTMDCGKQIIARIPHPNAGPPKFTTASEVATMHYLRNRLDIPVPRVFSYSCDENNPVGSEYIIMEKIEGMPLGGRWKAMTIDEKHSMLESVAGFQSRFISRTFSEYGNLYFLHDIDKTARASQLYEIKSEDDDVYCIGPTSTAKFWEPQRFTTRSNNGPCTLLANLTSHAFTEKRYRTLDLYLSTRD
jgi:Phosphotransferase enzyme family